MIKKLLMLMCVILGINAQETRIGAMGGFNEAITDFSNIHSFSTSVLKYGNLSTLDFIEPGNYSTYNFGAHFMIDDNSSVALYLNRPVSFANNGLDNLPNNVLGFTNQAELYYGMKMGDMNVAGGLNFARDSKEVDNSAGTISDKTTNNLSSFGIRLAAALMDLEADLSLNFLSAESFRVKSDDVTLTEDLTKLTWKGTGLGLNLRHTMKWSDKANLLSIVKYYNQGNKIEGKPWDQRTEDYTITRLSFVAAFNYKVDESSTLIFAVEPFAMGKSKTEDKNDLTKITNTSTTTITTLPAFYFGIESSVASWLIGRIGISQRYFIKTIKTEHDDATNAANNTSGETKGFNNNFLPTFGIGVKLNSFKLDAIFNEGLLYSGPQFISGKSNTISSRLTVSYMF